MNPKEVWEILPRETWDQIAKVIWEADQLDSVFSMRVTCRTWRDLIDDLIWRQFGETSFVDFFNPRPARLEWLPSIDLANLEMEVKVCPMTLMEEFGPFHFPISSIRTNESTWSVQHWQGEDHQSNLLVFHYFSAAAFSSSDPDRIIDLTSEVRHRYPQRLHHSSAGWKITLCSFPVFDHIRSNETCFRVQAGRHVYVLIVNPESTFLLKDLLDVEDLSTVDHFSSSEMKSRVQQLDLKNFGMTRVFRHQRILLGLKDHWSEGARLPVLISQLRKHQASDCYLTTTDELESEVGHADRWRASCWKDLRTGLSLLRKDPSQMGLWFWNPFAGPMVPTVADFTPLFPVKFLPAEKSFSLSLRHLSIQSVSPQHISRGPEQVFFLLEANDTRRWMLILEGLLNTSSALRIFEFSSQGEMISQTFRPCDQWQHLGNAWYPSPFTMSNLSSRHQHQVLVANPCWTGSHTLHLGHLCRISGESSSSTLMWQAVSLTFRTK